LRFSFVIAPRTMRPSSVAELDLHADREPGQLDQLSRRSDQPQALDEPPVQDR